MTAKIQEQNDHRWVSRPLIVDCPKMYKPISPLLEREKRGDMPSEPEVLDAYFDQLEKGDFSYFQHIQAIAASRQTQFREPSVQLPDRRMQVVIPVYREGENIDQLLEILKKQLQSDASPAWGATLVFNYAVPYANPHEFSKVRDMMAKVDAFRRDNPGLQRHIDYMTFARKKNTQTPIFPVALARKVGNDVIMYERKKMVAAAENPAPFYLSMMDADIVGVSEKLFDTILRALPENQADKPRIVRVRGSFDKREIKNDPFLHVFSELWEGATSAIGTRTTHNPFTVGRFSVIPMREHALTGGVLAKNLPFTDEDIRLALQIAARGIPIQTVEVNRYVTSARREVRTLQSLMQLLSDHNGRFDVETLECAALIRMYSHFAGNDHRSEFGNAGGGNGREAVPAALIQAMANAFYRFTTFSMFAVDRLYTSEDAPEVADLMRRFLAGDLAYFDVQIQTLKFIQDIFHNYPEWFESLKPTLADAEKLSRETIEEILKKNKIHYSYVEPEEPIYGITEPGARINVADNVSDGVILRAPFQIQEDQAEYMAVVSDFVK